MKTHVGAFGIALLLTVGACSSSPEATGAADASRATSTDASPTPGAQDISEFQHITPIEPGAYFVDPDYDPSTPLRVTYEVPVEGWSSWTGAVKFAGDGHVGVSITTVDNLVRHGCRDHAGAEPPVGPSVDDLATALADLAPFRVTSPPKDVTIYGYSGTYLELTVPDLDLSRCVGGNLMSWVAPFDTEPGDAFYGYTGAGYTEEFWILDVDGTRLMIAAERSAGSPPKDVVEQDVILDSIRIEP